MGPTRGPLWAYLLSKQPHSAGAYPLIFVLYPQAFILPSSCRPDGIHLQVGATLLLVSHPQFLPNLTFAVMALYPPEWRLLQSEAPLLQLLT